MAEERKCSSTSCGKDSCEGCDKANVDFSAAPNAMSHVKKVIGVVSGKGGVGKSLVTSLLAVMMSRKGYQCGILDADITGPSIPKAFGVKDKVMASEDGMLPVYSRRGIPVMSINLLLPNDTDPVVWRGPVIANTVKQFWSDVVWGDLDYLFVDMPPGTGDVPLTVFQSLPVDGIVVVASPQELVSMIVAKAVKMAELMKIPVVGLVENMSYFRCPDNGKDYQIFGESHIHEVAEEHGLPVLARIPIDPKLASACDGGYIEDFEGTCMDEAIKALEGK
ncbi:MAG: Mrp/NBP35 family ATP-binding protein [Lachnospiraceae bacterium]|nr:Mrp/NBP35 family ATP-binding protein [Lachnospiraceae bacterium]